VYHPARVSAGGGSTYDLNGIQLLVQTGSWQIDLAERYALAVLGADFNGSAHVAAANYYANTWLRDSYAWGTIPSLRDSSVGAYTSTELEYWLGRQQSFGGWFTAPKSGYFDETPTLISAVLDAYKVTGNLGVVLRSLSEIERGWNWLARGFIKRDAGSAWLIYANVPPHVAADWADQIGRHGYATQLEAEWYWATRSLGIMETLAGHPAKAAYFSSFAAHIRADINRLLWTVGVPSSLHAAPVPAFGHYRSWVAPRDYFELDSNFLCIVYGIADAKQAASIAGFVQQHDGYLLGIGTPGIVPARVLYGDYAPADYAAKHDRVGPGKYQSAYWPTIGSLAAIGLVRTGDVTEARRVLLQLSGAIVRDKDLREWYTDAGVAEGAPAFQWAARMFIVALYEGYLGIDEYAAPRGRAIETGIRVRAPAGAGSSDVAIGGRSVPVVVSGQGPTLHLSVAGQARSGAAVREQLLCAGCSLDAEWL
jgi:hypothetical protein